MSLAGDRIRELRIQNNMTLDDVARQLGINRQAVYKYEQGIVTNIPLDKIEKMATLFNSTPDYIAGWSEEPPDDPVPVTPEARIISGGIDKMPPDRREQALKIMQTVFAEYADFFKEETDNETRL